MQQNAAMQEAIRVKIQAFRVFATELTGQVVDQLCQEYEREVDIIHVELWQYRAELERCAELLSQQLHHSKRLHEMLVQVGEVHSTMVAQMEGLKMQEPDARIVHDMLEQLHTTRGSELTTNPNINNLETVVGKTREMKEEAAATELEFNRIMQLLQKPSIIDGQPGATVAPVSTFNGNGSTVSPNKVDSPPGSPWRREGTSYLRDAPSSTDPLKTNFIQKRKDALFNSIDRNTDGVISRAEWNQAATPPPVLLSSAQDAFFKTIDRNQDGVISRAEWNKATSPSRVQPSPQLALFNSIDRNKDGVISRAEWNQATTTSPVLQSSAQDVFFKSLDRNQDGVISRDEWNKATGGLQPRLV